MRLLIGVILLALGGLWLLVMARRRNGARSPTQAGFDFLTGAPRESVLAVGAVLMGLLLIAAHWLAG